ncbi:MAG: RDD family protein [Bacteriovoracaceae bacterium]|nr:RDD family protein [Bacteriovoracaceae bacterium]
MDRKYLLAIGPKRARLARLLAKSIDLGLVVVLAFIAYPWGLALAIGYLAVSDSLFDGQSIGKRMIGFRVVSLEDGHPCSMRQSLIRNLPILLPLGFALVPFWGWILCVILSVPLIFLELYFLFKLDSAHRLGDVMADTTVVGNDPQSLSVRRRGAWLENRKPMAP